MIGWVYTPPAYRKAGHANQLLSLLHYVLAPNTLLPPFPAELWGAEPPVEGFRDASFSVGFHLLLLLDGKVVELIEGWGVDFVQRDWAIVLHESTDWARTGVAGGVDAECGCQAGLERYRGG